MLMRNGTAATALGVSLLLAPACSGAPAASAVTPTIEGAGDESTCKIAKDPLSPFIVEWPGTNKLELDLASQRGVVIVSFVGCVMKVLANCQSGGGYELRMATPVRDRVSINNENDLYANFPLGVAGLRGDLRSSGKLDLTYVAVGERAATRPPQGLSGDCRGATHFVRTITVGAYLLEADGTARVGAGVDGPGAGVGARAGHREESRRLRGAGDVDSCERLVETQARCTVPLKLGLAPLSVDDSRRSTPPATGSAAVGPTVLSTPAWNNEGTATAPVQSERSSPISPASPAPLAPPPDAYARLLADATNVVRQTGEYVRRLSLGSEDECAQAVRKLASECKLSVTDATLRKYCRPAPPNAASRHEEHKKTIDIAASGGVRAVSVEALQSARDAEAQLLSEFRLRLSDLEALERLFRIRRDVRKGERLTPPERATYGDDGCATLR